MAPSYVDLHAILPIQHRGVQSWTSSLWNIAGRVLGLSNGPPKRTTEDVLRSFVNYFDTTDLPSVEDAALEDLCIREGELRGYALDLLEPYLTVELNIAASAYHHLANDDVKVYIAFFTAFATYFDDTYPDDPDTLVGVPGFTKVNIVVCNNASSEFHFFRAALCFLGETANQDARQFCEPTGRGPSLLFGEVATDFIVQGGLRYVTALILEIGSKSEPQTHKVDRYALFLRDLSGMPEAYTVFIFPKGLPYNLYIQALPLLCEVVNFMNDITSFYKEECENETHNLISLLAEARGEPKNQTLRYLVERCIQAHERTLCILSPHEGVRSSYESFVKGYLAFHLGAKRYRLSELDL